MGKNTPQRQDFIIDNLRVELDTIDDENDPEKKVVEENEEETISN